jgi:hypothetical protein
MSRLDNRGIDESTLPHSAFCAFRHFAQRAFCANAILRRAQADIVRRGQLSRRGGSVFHLQKVLGHSTLEMTRRYANLMTDDLQAVHQKISLLA